VAITVQFASRVRGLPTAAQVRRWARAAGAAAAIGAQFIFRLVNAAEGRRLNRDFRNRDYATNVLTFSYAGDGLGEARGADIVLCAQVVAREAREQGKPLPAHYAHLVVHGTLHALGHDHQKPVPAKRMETLELAILHRLGFANPY
jgi:probable rRNA maturation factor